MIKISASFKKNKSNSLRQDILTFATYDTQYSTLKSILVRLEMGRKKKDAEAAFFAEFENDEFSAAAGDSVPEAVAPGMFSI